MLKVTFVIDNEYTLLTNLLQTYKLKKNSFFADFRVIKCFIHQPSAEHNGKN